MKDTAAQTRTIGRYVLGDVLGSGAMGIVYKAEDPLIARTVAVKLLQITKALSADQVATVRERFLREAQTAGNLDHPNIARVLDAGCDDETQEMYLVMEYLPGASLEALVEQGSLSREKVAELVRQIGSALDAAHARGVIHRDVKPANILFSDDGAAKIADFGIARIATSHLTQDMRDLGTPVYMSPEQVSGKPLDGRADLFSLGVMAYHLLTGVTPFSGKNAVSVAYQIVHATPPLPSSVAPDLPPALDRVMSRILAKDPDDRYGSGREFYEDFSRVLMGLPNDSKTAKAPKPWRGAFDPRLLSLIGVALLTTGLLWAPHEFGKGTPPAEQPRRASMQSARGAAQGPVPAPVREFPKDAGKEAERGVRPQREKPAAPTAPKPARTTTKSRTGAKPPEVALAESARPSATDEVRAETTHAPSPAVPAEKEPEPVAVAVRGSMNVRLGHFIQRGTLELSLDGAPLFSTEFAKRNRLLPYQTSEWLGIAVPTGRHEITARVASSKGKILTSEPLVLNVAADGAIDLKLVLKDDAVVFKNGG